MRVCEQQQMDEVRASMNSVGEPSPYSTDSVMIEGSVSGLSGSGTSSPDGSNPNHNSKMKQMRKELKKRLGQPSSRVRTVNIQSMLTFLLCFLLIKFYLNCHFELCFIRFLYNFTFLYYFEF